MENSQDLRVERENLITANPSKFGADLITTTDVSCLNNFAVLQRGSGSVDLLQADPEGGEGRRGDRVRERTQGPGRRGRQSRDRSLRRHPLFPDPHEHRPRPRVRLWPTPRQEHHLVQGPHPPFRRLPVLLPRLARIPGRLPRLLADD